MTDQPASLLVQASAVAIAGRALLIEGEPGSGKSSLALALLARGAQLIGDDGVTITAGRAVDGAVDGVAGATRLIASAPPHIAGLIEVRGVGLVRRPVAAPTPLALILRLDAPAQRLPERADTRDWLGCAIPLLPFDPGTIAPAERALAALELHGLAPA